MTRPTLATRPTPCSASRSPCPPTTAWWPSLLCCAQRTVSCVGAACASAQQGAGCGPWLAARQPGSKHELCSIHNAQISRLPLACPCLPDPAGETWWRDAGGNFTVPVPGVRNKQDKASARGFEDELRWGAAAGLGARLASAPGHLWILCFAFTTTLVFVLRRVPCCLSLCRNTRSPHTRPVPPTHHPTPAAASSSTARSTPAPGP